VYFRRASALLRAIPGVVRAIPNHFMQIARVLTMLSQYSQVSTMTSGDDTLSREKLARECRAEVFEPSIRSLGLREGALGFGGDPPVLEDTSCDPMTPPSDSRNSP
jgi:hypothetical protein